MPSLLPGYEYDIFISYRQKDNKYDGWVTEFVSNLKKELEATFKEEVSIYFDENPHDGLLETHSVDKSLERKLKCLIFIPIISQTYCDPKSFAWQHEFCAFNRISKADTLGHDIVLRNGNVASRMLPVIIHELDAHDQALVEQEIGEPLRGIAFIYKEPGVNRPLKPRDSRNENQDRTDYRNQVNKVANAIRELVVVIQNPSSSHERPQPADHPTAPNARKRQWAFAALILLGLGWAGWKYFNTGPGSEKRRPRIAVLPFRQISESGDDYFAKGIKEVLVQHLQANEKLDVPPSLTATDRFINTTKTYAEIALELGADYLIDVSVRKWQDSIRLITKLIDPTKDDVLWQQDVRSPYAQFFKIQEGMAANISQSLGLTLSAPALKKVERVPTRSIEAYDYYLKAADLRNEYASSGFYNDSTVHQMKSLLLQSIKTDPEFAEPYVELAGMYFFLGRWDSVGLLLDKALSLYPAFPLALNLKSQFLFFHKKDTAAAIELAMRTVAEDPYNIQTTLWLGFVYHYWLKDERELLGLQYYLKAYQVGPPHEEVHRVIANIGIFLYHIGDYTRGESYLKRAVELQPKDWLTFEHLSRLYFQSGQFNKCLTLAKEMQSAFPLREDGYANEVFAHLYLGNYSEGIAAANRLLAKYDTNIIFSAYTMLLERTGNRDQAVRLWRSRLNTELASTPVNHWWVARLYAKLGERKKALDHLDQVQFTLTRYYLHPDYYAHDLMFESLRGEPRFETKIIKEKDRLEGIRHRLQQMEKENILELPKILRNP